MGRPLETHPFELQPWESPNAPTEEFLVQWLAKEGLNPARRVVMPGSRGDENKYTQPTVYVVASGQVQFGFPGYGGQELQPGDRLDIEPQVLHDIEALDNEQAILLMAHR